MLQAGRVWEFTIRSLGFILLTNFRSSHKSRYFLGSVGSCRVNSKVHDDRGTDGLLLPFAIVSRPILGICLLLGAAAIAR